MSTDAEILAGLAASPEFTTITNLTDLRTALDLIEIGVGRVEITVAYSEVAMHMRVAGTRMLAEPRPHGMAQLYTLNGERFSFPITAGEAGLNHGE